MIRFILLFTIFMFGASAMADNQNPNPVPPNTQEVTVNLGTTDNKTLRAPSKNPEHRITGYYDGVDGILYMYPSAESMWELVLSSAHGSLNYYASSSELCVGIHVGCISTFTITMTDESGRSFTGTVN